MREEKGGGDKKEKPGNKPGSKINLESNYIYSVSNRSKKYLATTFLSAGLNLLS